tara:strand:+ start:762 stop:1682 length:921 start_codon:yes stop_codon:yes gene_type:complete
VAKARDDCDCGFTRPHDGHIELAVAAEGSDGSAVQRLPDLRAGGGRANDLLQKVVAQNDRVKKLQGLNAPDVILTAEGDKLQRVVLELLSMLEPRGGGSRGRAKDPLAAAIAEVLEPGLSTHGFEKLGTGVVARIRDDAVQVIVFDRSSHNRTSCSLHYNTVPLYRPNSSLALAPPGSTLQGDWRFPVHTVAEASMQAALAQIEQNALTWLEQTATTDGLLLAFEECGFRPTENVTFARACCLARLNRSDEATELLRDEQYQDWWLERSPGVEALRSAIQGDTYPDLLDRWVEESVATLKLTRLAH